MTIKKLHYNKNSGTAKIRCKREGEVDRMKKKLVNEFELIIKWTLKIKRTNSKINLHEYSACIYCTGNHQ